MTATNPVHPRVYFHMPSHELIRTVPARIEDYTPWVLRTAETMPVRLPSGETSKYVGPYNWIVQTYIYLRNHGFPCELAADLPSDGIIITHSSIVPPALRPGPRQLIVEVKPDKFLQCKYSHVAVVQNSRDPLRTGYRRWFIDTAYVPFWPQPGLMPRDPQRGDRFENACFMGNVRAEFIREQTELETEVRRLGLTWMANGRDRWHDYREADVVVAVRQPDSKMFYRKPQSRLINAWIAGVPAVLSPDPAFEQLRQSPLDFLPASSVAETSEQLDRLRRDPALRHAMVENGRKRSPEFTAERNVRRWIETIEQQFVPLYHRWTSSPMRRRLFFASRALLHHTVGVDPDPR